MGEEDGERNGKRGRVGAATAQGYSGPDRAVLFGPVCLGCQMRPEDLRRKGRARRKGRDRDCRDCGLQSPGIQPLAASHLNANAMAAALQGRLETASADFQRLQNDLTLAVDARQKLEAQLSENELVKKVSAASSLHALGVHNTPLWQEFSTLTEKNAVYKLIGPVLVKQDQAEAKANVEKRLEFITSEMWVSRRSSCPLTADSPLRLAYPHHKVSALRARSRILRRKRRRRN